MPASKPSAPTLSELLGAASPAERRKLHNVQTKAAGTSESLPLSDEMLRHRPSGDLFGMTQNAAMGWKPQEILGPQFVLLSTQGGMRSTDGSPIAPGYHTGHWEVGLLLHLPATELRQQLRDRDGVDLVGDATGAFSPQRAGEVFEARPLRADLAADALLPDDTRLWAALQQASGGTWSGCVYDVDRIIAALETGRLAMGHEETSS